MAEWGRPGDAQRLTDVDLCFGSGPMLGSSPAMKRLWEELGRAAGADANLLLTGESGTGKDLFAHTVHERSRRRSGPLVVVNCCAIAPTLVESELFGHTAGAFSGANGARLGLRTGLAGARRARSLRG